MRLRRSTAESGPQERESCPHQHLHIRTRLVLYCSLHILVTLSVASLTPSLNYHIPITNWLRQGQARQAHRCRFGIVFQRHRHQDGCSCVYFTAVPPACLSGTLPMIIPVLLQALPSAASSHSKKECARFSSSVTINSAIALYSTITRCAIHFLITSPALDQHATQLHRPLSLHPDRTTLADFPSHHLPG